MDNKKNNFISEEHFQDGFVSSDFKKKPKRKHFFIFTSIFLGILILIAGGYYSWENYLSPSARYARQSEANYQKYLDLQQKYEAAMKADTYGGATPQDTLNLFIEAIKNGNVDLASNYFLLDDDGTRNALIKQNIQKIINENQTNKLLSIINNLQPSSRDTGSPDIKEFVTLDQKGFVDYSITLKLNKYSNIWKIENM